MSDTIHISFRYSESDYVRALRSHYASRLRIPFDIVCIIFLTVAGAFLWRSPNSHWLGVVFVAIAAAFALILISVFTVVPPLVFRRDPKFRDEYSLTFSPEGIHFRTDRIDSQLEWKFYLRTLITEEEYILYYGSHQFTLIPKRVFKDTEQRQAFEKLLSQHIFRVESKR